MNDQVSIFDFLIKGGIIMIPIGLLSIVAIYLIVERYLFIRNASKTDRAFLQNIKSLLSQNDFHAARMLCQTTDNAVARIIGKGVNRIGKPVKEIEAAMESQGNLELRKMEKSLGLLGIIAGIAPMLGFVGTIAGIIKIFYSISLADNISIGIIAGGLYEKMITSFAGLTVGIVAYAGYHYLSMMIDAFSFQTETSVNDFIDLLYEPSR